MRGYVVLLDSCPILFAAIILLVFTGCDKRKQNTTALDEQVHTEENQAKLNHAQPAPFVEWSLERDNLIKRFSLMNDRSVQMYMYVFIEGVGNPIGYYLINKVSSVNSQLTNPNQIIKNSGYEAGSYSVIPSPSEDGSYGTNGDAVFGFTPDGLYVETNMKYIVSTAPLKLEAPKIGEISIEVSNGLKEKLREIERKSYK